MQKGRVIEIELSNLLAVSNVRIGNLGNIESLANSLLALGQKNTLQVTPALEYAESLQKKISEYKSDLEELTAEAVTKDEDYQLEVKPSIDRLNQTIDTMQAILDKLNEFSQSDLEEKFAIVDGHRRAAAASSVDIESLRCELVSPQPDPSKLVLDQVTMGLHQKNLTHYEEARSYRELMDHGMSLEDIRVSMGFKTKEVIRQRILIIEIIERAESLAENGEEQAKEFLDLNEQGELRTRFLNKLGTYNDKNREKAGQPILTDSEFLSALHGCIHFHYFDDYKDFCNERFGNNFKTPVKPKTEKQKSDKPKRLSSKALKSYLDHHTQLLEVASESLSQGSTEITEEDVLVVKANVMALQFALGESEPLIPDSLKNAADQLKAGENKKAEEVKEVKKVAKQEERKELKEHVGPIEAKLSKAKKKLESLNKDLEKMHDEGKSGKSDDEYEQDVEEIESKIDAMEIMIEKYEEQYNQSVQDFKDKQEEPALSLVVSN